MTLRYSHLIDSISTYRLANQEMWLAGRPAEIPATQQVQVKMKDGLPGAAAIVEDGAIAGEQMAFGGQFRRDMQQFSQEGFIRMRSVVQSRKMFTRTNEEVCGRLRIDVFKGKDIVIFVNELGRDFLCADFTKDAVWVHQFTPEGVVSSRRTTNGVKPSLARSCSPKS